MARAKQTNRAEARRRYRQSIAQTTDEAADGESGASAPSTPATRRSGRPADGGQPRPGLLSAFRGAYRPAKVREDVAALPELIRGRWFLVSLGLVVLGFIAAVAAPANTISLFAFQTLTLPPAMVPIFLVGFTAPRASYLLGLVIGVVDIVLYSIYVVFIAGQSGTGVAIDEYLVTGLSIGIPASIVFSAAAAWYKRFLALSNPRRQQAASRGQRQTSKAAARH